MVRWRVVGFLVLAVAAVVVAPEPVVLAGLRLAAYTTTVAGASLLIARVGAADLALAAAVAAGAYAGGVGSALAEVPVMLGLPAGTVAGAAVGAMGGTVHGRSGRSLGALASLAVAVAVVPAVAAWSAGGGVAGFHAVALPTPWGARADLVAVVAVLVGSLAVAATVARTRSAALAALAVRAPQVVVALGHRPAVATGRIGAVAGGLCGVGGVVLATVTGSVVPGGFGLDLAAALVLAALLGGAAPWGPVAGAALVWGPSTLWPLVPLVGTAPPLLVAGPLGLAVLAARRGRPLLADGRGPGPPARPARPTPRARVTATDVSGAAAADVSGTDAPVPAPPPPSPRRPLPLAVTDLELLGRRVSLRVDPGEVVAVTGPNGAGKSTLLATIGGQLDDGGAVELAGAQAPRGARARAAAGLARSWQRAPDVAAKDVLAVAGATPDSACAAAWARRIVGEDLEVPGVLQLVLVASARPGLVLLDEPTDLAPGAVASFVGGLTTAGAGVLVVDHRREVVALADRVIALEGAR